jgi:hypothetical protein
MISFLSANCPFLQFLASCTAISAVAALQCGDHLWKSCLDLNQCADAFYLKFFTRRVRRNRIRASARKYSEPSR